MAESEEAADDDDDEEEEGKKEEDDDDEEEEEEEEEAKPGRVFMPPTGFGFRGGAFRFRLCANLLLRFRAHSSFSRGKTPETDR